MTYSSLIWVNLCLPPVSSVRSWTLPFIYVIPFLSRLFAFSCLYFFFPPRSVTPTRLLCNISRTHISITSACRRLIGIFYRLVVGECSWYDPNLQWLTVLNFRSCYSSTFISIIAYSRVRHISSVYIHHTTSGVITPLRNVSPHRSRPACAFSPRSVGMPKPRHWQHPYISSSYFRDPRHPTLSTSFPTAGLLTPFLPLFLLEIRSSAVIVSPVPLNLPYFNPPMCTQKPFLQHAIVSRRIRRLRRGRGSGAWSRRMQYEGMILYKLGDRCSRSVNHLGEGKEKEERESDLIIVTYCWYSVRFPLLL